MSKGGLRKKRGNQITGWCKEMVGAVVGMPTVVCALRSTTNPWQQKHGRQLRTEKSEPFVMCWFKEMAAAVATDCPLSVFTLHARSALTSPGTGSDRVGPTSWVERELELHHRVCVICRLLGWFSERTVGEPPVKKCRLLSRAHQPTN